MLEHLQRLPIEIIQSFLDTRNAKASGIKQALADYIIQINDAYNLNKTYRAIGKCAEQLRLKHPELSLPTCKCRVQDAIQFFNVGCSVTADAWNSYYADFMKNLAEVNLIALDRKEARVCMEKARTYDLAASANRIDPKRIQFKHQVVSADMHLTRMGITPQGVLKAYEEAKAIIQAQDIALNEQKRLLTETGRELNVKEQKYTTYEEVEDK